MNPDPLGPLNYVSGANVFVTATSPLPNGRLEILEVYIFNRERMGILVSFCIGWWFSWLWLTACGGLPGSRYYLCSFLNRRLRLTARHCCSWYFTTMCAIQWSPTHRHNSRHGGTLGNQRTLICSSALGSLRTLYQCSSATSSNVSRKLDLCQPYGVSQHNLP